MWKYDIVKNAFIGAIIGALASFIIPFMRPTKGAFIGALILIAIGVYKNLSNKSTVITKDDGTEPVGASISEEIERFHKLLQAGAITATEFEEKKRQLLRR